MYIMGNDKIRAISSFNIHHFFVVRAFQFLSSGSLEIYNKLLWTEVTLLCCCWLNKGRWKALRFQTSAATSIFIEPENDETEASVRGLTHGRKGVTSKKLREIIRNGNMIKIIFVTNLPHSFNETDFWIYVIYIYLKQLWLRMA